MKVRAYQQPHRLRELMGEAGISHGATVRANIFGAIMQPVAGSMGQRAKLHFCPAEAVEVEAVVDDGDGGPLSRRVFISERLRRHLPHQTCFMDIENALISSNGAIRVHVDDASRLVTYEGGGKTQVIHV